MDGENIKSKFFESGAPVTFNVSDIQQPQEETGHMVFNPDEEMEEAAGFDLDEEMCEDTGFDEDKEEEEDLFPSEVSEETYSILKYVFFMLPNVTERFGHVLVGSGMTNEVISCFTFKRIVQQDLIVDLLKLSILTNYMGALLVSSL
jgi:hypothetical protein